MIARPARGSVSTTGTSPGRRPRPVRASRQDAIPGRLGGTFPLLFPNGGNCIAADSQARRDNSSRPASRPACRRIPLSTGELRPAPRPAPGTDSAGSRLPPAMATGYCRQYTRAQSGYRVTIVLSDRREASATPARTRDISDRSTTRNARRTVTVAGYEIDDLDYCQVAQGGGLRGTDSRHRTIYRSCQRVLAWHEFLPQLTTPRSAHRPGQPTPSQRPPVPGRPRSRPAPAAGHLAGWREAPAGRGRRERAAAAGQVRR